jgi:hypothetical protein
LLLYFVTGNCSVPNFGIAMGSCSQVFRIHSDLIPLRFPDPALLKFVMAPGPFYSSTLKC